ncbi:MAG: class I SAM-dependent methyltransferase [Blautia sp.]
MTESGEFLKKYVNKDLIRIIISGPRKKEGPSKIQIRPLLIKGQLKYQVTQTVGQKELHQNYEEEEVCRQAEEWIHTGFRQLQMESRSASGTLLMSKKGKATIKIKKRDKEQKKFVPMLAHNRQKHYLLEEGIPVPFLMDLGVMTEEGKIRNAKYDKFRQMNRFLEFIEDILPKLPKDREVTIIDFGCGKSYLTFAMYHYLHQLKGYDVRIIGLDLKEDVIAACSRLAEKYHYEKLKFYQGDIASYEGCEQADMVVTLHACDTATDYALFKAVQWGASVILSVPCCQHELNRQIKNEQLAPVLDYGILKERFAAILTDGLRAQMLESAGYDTQILEFIDMEHTPKNLLIRAVKNENKVYSEQQKEEWETCARVFGVHPTLESLLFLEGNHR